MDTGSAESLQEREARCRALAEQVAALLAEAEQIAPGSVSASNGQITLLGASVRRGFSGWEVR
ncbi:hypothetical protein ACIQM4_34400 [Streptomyces sp. NPDC091272]|uniref:hypothetical protein n=1 Tax=Streptomyces sp. NPDC091272 TaxID=3365981 RepID=UPI0037FB9834